MLRTRSMPREYVLTSFLSLRIAMTAAMKKVLSPISEAKITPHDLKKPSKNRFDIVAKN